MRYNLIWSSAIALSLVITSFSYAQTIEIDFRSGFGETGRSIDNSTLEGVIVDPDAEVIERTGIPFSVPVLEDERTGAEQLMLTVNGFTGGDLFIQELDLAGLLTPSPEQFTVNDIVIDNVNVNTRDEFSFVTDANPDGMFLEAGETLRLAATNGSIALQGLTVEVVTDDPPIDLICDVNRDGVVDFLDIAPFILVLSLGEFQVEADCNQDGVVDFLDIAPFILILSS